MRRLGFFPLLVVVGMVSAACAAGNAPGNSTPQSSTSSQAAACTEVTPVRLQVNWLPQAQFAGNYVAKDKGFYAAECLDVTILPGGPDVVPLQQVSGGAADVALQPISILLEARDKGLPLVSVAQVMVKDPQVLVARKSSGILKPEDLRGKKVGVWTSSGDQIEFEAVMRKVGLDPKRDVIQVSQSFTMDQFLNEEIDAASAFAHNELLTLYDQGMKPEDLWILHYDEYGVAIPWDAMVTTEQYLADNRDVLVRLVRGSMRGWQYAIDNQPEAVDIIIDNLLQGASIQYTKDQQTRSMAVIATYVAPDGTQTGQLLRLDPAVYETVASILVEADLVETQPDVARAVDVSVWEAAR